MKKMQVDQYVKLLHLWFIGTLASRVSKEINEYANDATAYPMDKDEMINTFCSLVKQYTNGAKK